MSDFLSFDRSVISGFTVPGHLLAEFHSRYGSVEVNYFGNRTFANRCRDEGSSFAAVAGEFIFWAERLNVDSKRHWRNIPVRDYPLVSECKARLSLVTDRSDLIDYFRVGIWDVEQIEMLVSHGVDASLAAVV